MAHFRCSLIYLSIYIHTHTYTPQKTKQKHTFCNEVISMAKCRGVTLSMMAIMVTMILVTEPYHVKVNGASNITCEQVTSWLTPCILYGILGGTVSDSCCSGIKALNAASKTTEDVRTQCNCVKEGAAGIPGLNYDRVNELPTICGSKCPYKLTPDLDCSKVNRV